MDQGDLLTTLKTMQRQLNQRDLAEKLKPYADQIAEIWAACKEENIETIYFAAVPNYSLSPDPFNPLVPVSLRWYIHEHDGKRFCIVFYPNGEWVPFVP